ncbi:MAG: outer membrane protein [Steroidobacterales bacterium]
MRKLVAFVVLAFAATHASAADNGIYLGAATVLDQTLHASGGPYDLDVKNRPYKLIIGIRPIDMFGVEANYVDYGSAKNSDVIADLTVNAHARFYDAFAVGYLPLPLVDLYAKAGLVRWDTDFQLTTIAGPQSRVSKSGTDFAYGAGAQVRFGSLAARLEYERFEVSDADKIDLLSLGVTWTFL